MAPALTKPERETLKAVWRLTSVTSAVAADAAARTGDLATSLRVAPATMTTTVKRLADRGLLEHTPYHGVALSPEGRRVAMAVIRRHRIVERFLADLLGYSWAEADRLAPTFEHQLPQEVEERLFVALDRPATCPHGHPIPGAESDSLPAMPPLYDLEPGDRAVVVLPGSTAPDVVRFLDGLGLRPGAEVEVREKHPFDGPLVVTVEGRERTLGDKIARQILVRPAGVAVDGGVASTPGAGITTSDRNGVGARAVSAVGPSRRGGPPRPRREKQPR
jgi:DtxR family Mn-dependent transcriptional regulator